LLILPMTVPVLLLTIAWIGLASPDAGFINLLWKQLFGFNHSLLNIYSFWGIVAVLVFRFTPYVLLLLYATFTAMDVSMEEASRVLGGSPTRTFIRITLPVLAPSLQRSKGANPDALLFGAGRGTARALQRSTFPSETPFNRNTARRK